MAALTAALSSVAIVVSPLPVAFQLCGLVMLGAVFFRQWKTLSRTLTLRHHGGREDTINEWSVEIPGQPILQGTLRAEGYRSSGLLVMVFQSVEGAQLRRIPVWRDSVLPQQFSYLNLQLMFNSSSA